MIEDLILSATSAIFGGIVTYSLMWYSRKRDAPKTNIEQKAAVAGLLKSLGHKHLSIDDINESNWETKKGVPRGCA